MVKIKITNRSHNPLPDYATGGAAGMELRAYLDEPVTLLPGERKLIPTGLHIEIPPGYEAQVRPRSGLAYKQGVTVLNAPGTIDSDYRGDVGVILINHGSEMVEITTGMRIAQLVVAPYSTVSWQPVEILSGTERGEGGFGHTGTQ